MEEENNQNLEVHEEEEEINTEDVAVDAYNRIDALVELLIKKGIISEQEIDDMEDKLLEEFENEDVEKSSEESQEEKSEPVQQSFGHEHSSSCGCGQ